MKKSLLFILFVTLTITVFSQTTFTVNSTNDLPDININDAICADENGDCTLRAAIQNANKTSNKDTVEFNISGTAPFVISVVDVMQPIQQPLILDARTQAGYANVPLIEIEGGSLLGAHNGLQLIGNSTGSEIYGLSIGGFKRLEVYPYSYGFGIYSNTGNHIIQANYVGMKPDGTTINSNTGHGMYFNNTGGNLIGGTQPNQGNLISGNGVGGVTFEGSTTNSAASNNLVQGNLIGTDVTGTLIRGNRFNVQFINAPNNTLGGNSIEARNIISGSNASDDNTVGTGVGLVGTESYGNKIIGNYIGTDITGTQSLPNVRGGIFVLFGANNNEIGTDQVGEGNIISGNGQYGIYLQGNTTTPVVSNNIRGNYIGVDASGNLALPNSAGIMMLTGENNNNIIGGVTANSKNVISGNNIGIGIYFGENNQIIGNYIGTNATGTVAIANNFAVDIADGNNRIGGQVAGSRNIISGNNYGIYFSESTSSGSSVIGNYIGIDVSGNSPLSNGTGIYLSTSATNIAIGGANPLDRNIISGNSTVGISVWGSSNTVQNNYIGLNASGNAALPNTNGITMNSVSTNNVIGGGNPSGRNIISGNSNNGVSISGTSHTIQNNYIGLNPAGTGIISNGYGGLILGGNLTNTQVSENTISGNGTIVGQSRNVSFSAANNVHFFSNKVGTLPDGNTGVTNIGVGLFMNNSSDNIIGGTSELEGNIIGNQNTSGIQMVYNCSNNTISNNRIGVGLDGVSDIGNNISGIVITGGNTGNEISNNIIANNQRGVDLDPALGIPTQVTISENSIYNNSVLGIDLRGASANDVDDADTGVNNLQNTPEVSAISYLGGEAIEISYAVPSSITNSAYPLLVEFFGAVNGQGKFFIDSDLYTAPGAKTITINLPIGYNVSDYNNIVATATDANGNTSEFGINVNYTLSVTHFENENNSFKLYPNPVSSRLFLQSPTSENYNLNVVNTLGQVILSQNNNASSVELDVRSLSNGLYFLNISSENKNPKIIKFIKK